MLNLIRKLRRRPEPVTFAAPLDPGRLVYAIGDIHGRHDLLAPLLDKVLADAEGRADRDAEDSGPVRIVFLGDYIDRGEGARQTIEMLRAFAGRGDAEAVFLMGNHEQMLLRFLEEPSAGARWLRYGGLQTLLSYGVRGVTSLTDPEDALRLRDEMVSALGADIDFIESLGTSHRAGNVLFTHAGADPGAPPEEQDVNTLLWGSERFQQVDRADGVWVVYGHFIVDEPFASRGRIAVDTGAYFSGRLTAARIAGDGVSFLQT